MLTTMKGGINSNTVILGDFNTSLTPMDRSTRQKINKETQALNDTINQVDFIDIYRTFHSKTADYQAVSSKCPWNILQDRSHLGSQLKPL